MNPNPSHRPDRWARLKKQLARARGAAELSYLYICRQGIWDDFTEWRSVYTDADPCNPVFEHIAAQERLLDELIDQLNIAKSKAEMYQKGEQFYYGLLGKKDEKINRLITMIANLTAQLAKQRRAD